MNPPILHPDFPIREEPGWKGAFTRNQAAGAITGRVRKAVFEPGDANTIGSLGTVLGSIAHPGPPVVVAGHSIHFLYFVEWDAYPRQACGVLDYKIARA